MRLEIRIPPLYHAGEPGDPDIVLGWIIDTPHGMVLEAGRPDPGHPTHAPEDRARGESYSHDLALSALARLRNAVRWTRRLPKPGCLRGGQDAIVVPDRGDYPVALRQGLEDAEPRKG